MKRALAAVITCIVMSLLISLCVSPGTRNAFKSGAVGTAGRIFPTGGLLYRLPDRPWKLGLLIGLATAVVVMPCLIGAFSRLGVTSFSFSGFLLFKAVYTPLVACAVTRWVILRQLAGSGA